MFKKFKQTNIFALVVLMRLSGFHLHTPQTVSLQVAMFILFFSFALASLSFIFFCLVPFVLFLFSCLPSLSISPFSHCYLAEVLISTERKKTRASTDLATSCFFRSASLSSSFPVLRYFTVTFAQEWHSLSLFFLSFFFFFCYWLGLCVLQVTNPSSILPLRGWRLAISIPTPPLRLPHSSYIPCPLTPLQGTPPLQLPPS